MWNELGIAPCDDPKRIRRAYALRLKAIDPDRDLEAFERLRRALEWALAQADSGRDHGSAPSPPRREPRQVDRPEDNFDPLGDSSDLDRIVKFTDTPPETTVPAGEMSMPSAPIKASNEEACDKILLTKLDAALRRHDAAEAMMLYYRASASGALPLRRAGSALDHLFAVAVEDSTLDSTAFRELARSFGWDKPALQDSTNSALRQKVIARLVAEDWYTRLCASADQNGDRIERRKARVARLLLKRIGWRWFPRIDNVALAACMDEYRKHRTWLTHRFDTEWMNRLEQRLRRRELRSLGLYSAIVAVLLVHFVRLWLIEIGQGRLSVWYLVIGPLAAAFLLLILKLLLTELVRLLTAPRTDGVHSTRLRRFVRRVHLLLDRWSSPPTR